MNQGLVIVVSGPSGSGKGSLVKKLLESNEGITFAVSATTRKPRNGEVDGQHYHFITMEEFKKMIESDELMEWVEYCGNYYGTPAKWVLEQLSRGQDVILEIDVEGAIRVKKRYPESILIFLMPPEFSELRRRIEKRGTEKGEELANRLKRASEEIKYANKYDYLVVNSDISRAVADIEAVIKAEKLKIKNNTDLIVRFEEQLAGMVMKSD